MSNEHASFLRAIYRRRRLIILSQVMILVIFIFAWEILTYTGALDPFIFSSPSRILKTTIALASSGNLFIHIGVTLGETCVGFILSTVIGTFIAMILWWFPSAAKVLDPYLVVLNALPKIALGPILIVWMGAGVKTIIMIAILVSIVVTITGVLSGFNEVGTEKHLLMRSLGASKIQILRMVILPASVPTIVTALKLNVGMAWVGAIVGEFLVSRAGLGYLAVYGGQIFKLDIVMTSVVILSSLAALMYFAVARFEAKVLRRITA